LGRHVGGHIAIRLTLVEVVVRDISHVRLVECVEIGSASSFTFERSIESCKAGRMVILIESRVVVVGLHTALHHSFAVDGGRGCNGHGHVVVIVGSGDGSGRRRLMAALNLKGPAIGGNVEQMVRG